MKYCCGVVRIALEEDVQWPDDDVLLNPVQSVFARHVAHVSMSKQPKPVA